MRTYSEMDEEGQGVVISGIMRRFGVRKEAVVKFLDAYPDFDPSVMSYMQIGDENYDEIMKRILWGNKTYEEIAAICSDTEGGDICAAKRTETRGR